MTLRVYLLILTACLVQGQIGCQTPETKTTVVATPQIAADEKVELITPTNAPRVDERSNHLVVCMSQEPKTLFWYGRETVFEEAVLHGIYENDLTTISYGYQAAGLERVPSFVNGDAATRVVHVNDGDSVVDANGDVITLEIGSRIIDSAGELRIYDGTTLLLDQLVVDYKMKQRTWSDGQPVTAADSVFSFNLASRPDSPGDKYLVDRTASYRATGNLQIRWTSLPGLNNNSFQSNFYHPLPRHTWLDLSPAELTTADASSRFPIGDGPFKIVEWLPGKSIRLEPNPFYYRSQNNYPRLDGVTFRFIPDTNQRISQLLAGNCHLVTHDGLDADLIPFFLAAEAEQLMQTSIRPDRYGWEIIFGINSWNDYGDGIGRPDWFEDVRVRQAIAMCIDRQQMVDTLYYGRSMVSHNYVPPTHPQSARDVSQWPFDLVAANGLLDEAGYLDSNADGIREDPITGTDFRVSLFTGLDRREHIIAQMLEKSLQDCGIALLIERLSDTETLFSLEENKKHGRRFDLALSSSEVTNIPDCGRFASWQVSGSPDEINLFTDEPFTGWDGRNNSGWSNPTFDAICAAALVAPTGTPEQKSNQQQAQRIFSEELPVLPLMLEPKITITRPDVLHIINNPSQDSELWNIFAVEIAP